MLVVGDGSGVLRLCCKYAVMLLINVEMMNGDEKSKLLCRESKSEMGRENIWVVLSENKSARLTAYYDSK